MYKKQIWQHLHDSEVKTKRNSNSTSMTRYARKKNRKTAGMRCMRFVRCPYYSRQRRMRSGAWLFPSKRRTRVRGKPVRGRGEAKRKLARREEEVRTPTVGLLRRQIPPNIAGARAGGFAGEWICSEQNRHHVPGCEWRSRGSRTTAFHLTSDASSGAPFFCTHWWL